MRNHKTSLWLLLVLLLLGACSKNDPAPNVALDLINGQQSTLQAYKGKVLFVNFWATSCSTCVKEMPGLSATQAKYEQQGYQTIAIAMQYDNPDYIKAFVTDRKLPFVVSWDKTGSAAKQFGEVQVTPTSFLIDKQGNIIQKYMGEPDYAELHQKIEKALKES